MHTLIRIASYSADLALSDYFLFIIMKERLGKKKVGSNDDVIAEMYDYSEGLEQTWFLRAEYKRKENVGLSLLNWKVIMLKTNISVTRKNVISSQN